MTGFRLFLTIYGAIYAVLNAYVGSVLYRGLHWSWRGALAFGLAAPVMIAAPVLGHMFEHQGQRWPALFFTVSGTAWMLLVLWMVVFGAAADLWNLLARLVATAFPAATRAHLPIRVVAIGILCAMPPLIGWGLWEASAVRLKTIHLESPRLPPDSEPIRIVQISDLHLGLLVGHRTLDRVLARVEEAAPHLLVATGDIMDSTGPHLVPLVTRLRDVSAPAGKFAVFGNHEWYVGEGKSLALLKAAQFTVLRDEHAVVRCGNTDIVVAGVDYPHRRFASHGEADALKGKPPGLFTVMLKHIPRYQPELLEHIDLQLSGHTHGGQVFPFELLVRLRYPHTRGLHRLAPASWLYITTGAGTWGPPIRILARPEVVLFTISPAEAG